MAADIRPPFDPRAMLGALERRRVAYVVIGAVARVLHGTDELTDGLDICPQRRPENLSRLLDALDEIEAVSLAGREEVARRIAQGNVVSLPSPHGPLQVVPLPAGTRGGWDDLRRRANRDALGDGVRVPVASLDDLIRMSAALGRERDLTVGPSCGG